MRQILDLLQKADQAADLDAIKPGLEQGIDQAVDQMDAAVDQAGGEEGGGGQTAAVYKGKGGKGLQSFLARGAPKLQGKAMGAVLKHIEKQLKAQGVTVSEGALDEVQGWMWYGLVEDMMQEHYGQPITLQEILDATNRGNVQERKGERTIGKGGAGGENPFAALKDVNVAEEPAASDTSQLEAATSLEQYGEVYKQLAAAAGKTDQWKHIMQGLRLGTGDKGQPASVEEISAMISAFDTERTDWEHTKEGTTPHQNKFVELAHASGRHPNNASGEAGEEAPIEPVEPTVQNTAPEGAASIKVFRGKGGEGLQSALASSRDKLGIDQQTVAVIIKSVEEWANANQIKVENVSAETFDTIISEIFTKYKVRKLQEVIYKLRS
jgi:hypothetical protein